MSSENHDAHDPAVCDTLQRLHPQGTFVAAEQVPACIDPDLRDANRLPFWEPLITHAILSFPRSTALKLRASQLQESIRGPGRGAPLISALARLAHMWTQGAIPQALGPALCRANLTSLRRRITASGQ